MYKPISNFSKLSSFLSANERELLLKIVQESSIGDWDEGRQETGYYNLPIRSQNPDKPTRECIHPTYKENITIKEDNITSILLKSLNFICFGKNYSPLSNGEFPCKIFDSYILKFPVGSCIPPHIDPSPKNKTLKDNNSTYVVEHRRINIMIQNSEEGGDLGVVVNDYTRDIEYHSFANGDGYMFRPDVVKHSVKKITKGTRLLWSVGCIIEPTNLEVCSTKQVYIIGPGEVGKRIGISLTKVGYNCRYISRNDTEGWQLATSADDDTSLRILCMREDDLQASLSKFPPNFPFAATIVLVQNGFLDVSVDTSLLSDTTRLLVYFTSKGDFYEMLQPSPVHGPLSTLLSDALTKGGIDTVEIRDTKTFIAEMATKGIWNAVLGLPPAAHKIDFATYRKEHQDEMKHLIQECTQVLNVHYKLELDDEHVGEVIEKTTKNLGWMKGGVRGLAFRNKAIVALGKKHGVSTPVNDLLLSKV